MKYAILAIIALCVCAFGYAVMQARNANPVESKMDTCNPGDAACVKALVYEEYPNAMWEDTELYADENTPNYSQTYEFVGADVEPCSPILMESEDPAYRIRIENGIAC